MAADDHENPGCSFAAINDTDHEGGHDVHLASWRWDYVELPMIISIMILLTALVKIGKITILKVQYKAVDINDFFNL